MSEQQEELREELTHPKYRADIDGLRAVAVISVLIYHAYPDVLRSGFIGVDIFFVISGFLISTIIFKSLLVGEFSFRDFYARRIRRIFPALITVLLSAFLAGWFIFYPDEYRQLGKHIYGGAGFISNFILWGESGYFDAVAESKPLLHLWSLGIEEQYYIFFPFLVWCACKRQLNFLTFTILVGLISFGLNLHFVYKDAVFNFYQPQTRVWELMVGSVLSLIMIDTLGWGSRFDGWLDRLGKRVIYQPEAAIAKGQAAANVKAFVGLSLLVVGLVLINNQMHFPGKWAIFPTVGAALLIWAGPKAVVNRVLLANKFMVWVGKLSYPLYLWHWVILVYLRILANETPSAWVRGGGLVGALALAWLTYTFIEKPLRFGGDSRKKTRWLVIAMVAMAGLGIAAYKSHGFRKFRETGNRLDLIEKFEAIKASGPKELTDLKGYVCFQLPPHKNFDFYSQNNCIPPNQVGTGKKTILLIGDSHSASLSLGLRAWSESQGFNYYQISSGSCSLFSDDISDPACQEYSRKSFEAISLIRPNVLVVDSFWSHVEKDFFKNYGKWPSFLQYLSERFSNISTLGANKVILIGEVPNWTNNLPDVLVKDYVSEGKPIPEKTFSKINPASLEMDRQMRNLVYPKQFVYLSLRDLFCDSDGCMTRLSEQSDWEKDIVFWDYGHLTATAARWVVDNLLGAAIIKALDDSENGNESK